MGQMTLMSQSTGTPSTVSVSGCPLAGPTIHSSYQEHLSPTQLPVPLLLTLLPTGIGHSAPVIRLSLMPFDSGRDLMTREPGRAPPRHAHGDLTSLAPHERLPEILVVPRPPKK